MSHVIFVLGQAAWIDLTTASAWQQSPIADSLMMQIDSGGAIARPVCGEGVIFDLLGGDPPG